MRRRELIRTIYLYLFSLLGLVLLTIGGVQFVELGLRTWVFPQADQESRIQARLYPPGPPMAEGRADAVLAGDSTLAPHERAALERWVRDYEEWRERSRELDPVAGQRARQASNALALILIGLPLYLFHWRIVRREAAEARAARRRARARRGPREAAPAGPEPR